MKDVVYSGDTVFFWMIGEENEVFSNWYPAAFTVDEVTYFNTEQYFMAQKARAFDDFDTMNQILAEKDPAKCKKLGRLVKNFDSATWDWIREEVMLEGNLEKFKQNRELREILLSTGDTLLAEASPYDKIWGIGLTADQAASVPSKEWPGDNLMGECLMEVRKRMRSYVEE